MKPYAQRGQAPYTCANCETRFVVDAWIEREDVYLEREECPECKAPIDLDVCAGDVTPLVF